MDDSKKKMLYIGGGVLVVILILVKLLGKSSSSAQAAPMPIQNIGPAGSEVNDRYTIQAQSALATQQSKQAGLSSLLDYSTAGKTIQAQTALGMADLTNTLAIKNKELDTAFNINSQNVESDNLQARLQAETMVSIASQQAGVQMAAIGSQVSIASIAAGVQSERTKADLTLGLRGYDSADYATGSQEKLGLANIDLQKFGITTAADITKEFNWYNFKLGKKAINADVTKTQIGADVANNQTNAQIAIAKIQKPTWFQSLMSGLPNILGAATGGFGF